MGAWAIIPILGVALGIGISGTWLSVLSGSNTYLGWRRRASLMSLLLPTIGLVMLIASSITVYFLPLQTLDDHSMQGGWYAFLAYVLLFAQIAEGVLPICGLVSAMLGIGTPRLAGAMWSAVIFSLFFVSLILAVNSFH
ncbi:MAG: hypothetical protein JWN92_2731 [Candidatus Acidoferrum typicum]|nr:hypothetical protein [Candidatus Acidoferrum typicum]